MPSSETSSRRLTCRPPPPPLHATTDTISRTRVNVPISRAALVDMTGEPRSNTNQHQQQRSVKSEPSPLLLAAGTRSQPLPSHLHASPSQPPSSTPTTTTTAAAAVALPPPPPSRTASSSSLRRHHSRSRNSTTGSSSHLQLLKHASSTNAMTANTQQPQRAIGSTPLLPTSSSATVVNSSSTGHVDPTQVATTIWPMFLQTVLRNANNPHAVALSGCTERRDGSRHRRPHLHHHSRSTYTRPTAAASAAMREVHYTWPQYYERVYAVARVLAHIQFRPGDGAVICATSAPDLYFVYLAVVALGGTASHVRASWSADELVRDVFPLSNARVLVLDAATMTHRNVVDALQRAADRFIAVIVLTGDPIDIVLALAAASPSQPQSPISQPQSPISQQCAVLTMDDVWSLAKSVDDTVVPDWDTAATPHTTCAIAFAYDEQGRVRGARLTHDNVLFTAATLATACGPLGSTDRLVAYLPLYHAAAQVLELFVPLVSGLSVVCAPSYSEPLVHVIARKKPTVFFATPETWTHFSAQVYRAKSDVHAGLYRWAKTRATHNSKKLLFGHNAHRSLGYMLAKALVLKRIKKRIGLESCAACYSVLAPLDFELEKLFQTIDIPIYQLFGCAETTGFAAINFPHAWEFGSSGRALPQTTITCDDVTHEVLLRGRNVFAGYVQSQSDSRRSSNDPHAIAPPPPNPNSNPNPLPQHRDHAFRFRQTGFLTPNGFLKINDPPDFVVLASGDWLPVAPYERALLAHGPELARVVLVGEARAFLSVLLFLKTAPMRSMIVKSGAAALLADDALRVGKAIGSTATTVGEAIKCQAWAIHFDDALETLRTQCGLSGFYVRKWILMTDAFAVESGELDPDTGAVVRKVVDGKYQSLLDSLYT